MFTGHLAEETTLESQTALNGDVMRGYPYFHLPGIDLLWDRMELNTAKQCQSAVRQLGRPGMPAELYGATGWDLPFSGFKAQGDWLAALGVTLRVHHLAWVSMEGEAKRDYPGSICQHQPWWREFKLVEDHFARVNAVMTRGRPLARVAVVHPIESFWHCFGPVESNQAECEARERLFKELTEWLLFGLVDFDFISEALLPQLCPLDQAGAPLRVGEMAYDTVLVPGLRSIRGSTLDRLERFASQGGKLLFVGAAPSLVDAKPSGRASHHATLAADRDAILTALAPFRPFTANTTQNSLLHQARQEGTATHIFLCNTDREKGGDLRLGFPGKLAATLWDTMTGESAPLPLRHEADNSILEWHFPPHGHLLLSLEPEEEPLAIPETVPVTLSEPNALLLDIASWRWDDGAWEAPEELLRIEDAVRRRTGLSLRRSYNAQPWSDRSPSPELGRLELCFSINCEASVAEPLLALERPELWRVELDGQEISAAATGWWVDEAIRTLPLPPLGTGEHRLVMSTQFTRRGALECCYLLGAFGVRLDGARATVVDAPTRLAWGDWTTQGLPFYTGNVSYHLPFQLPRTEDVQVSFEEFANPLLRLAVDGHDAGPLAFAPWERRLAALAAGGHSLEITAFGTRNNAFGCLHTSAPNRQTPDPSLWRCSGALWDYAWHLTPMGILSPPRLSRITRN